jgi:branched-chain amino acid transport system ATP-binding protein
MSSLILDRVSRSFGGVRAVHELSLKVERGSITGIIGPNGAGKSTAINLISGFLRLTTGHVRLDGIDISELEAPEIARAGIARTFQTVRLLNEDTVLANVLAGFHIHRRSSFAANLLGLPGALREMGDLRDRAREVLEDFGMTSLQAVPAGKLSYGHQRRVEVMRALATRPKLLLLDEPAAGMNDVEASHLGKTLVRLASDGLTILLIEHNMRFVMSLCSKLYVMDSGRLIATGGPDEIQRNPAVIEAYLGADYAGS